MSMGGPQAHIKLTTPTRHVGGPQGEVPEARHMNEAQIAVSDLTIRREFPDPFMIQEWFPTVTETAFASHPSCVFSTSYEKL
jgi:hypothetical protein